MTEQSVITPEVRALEGQCGPAGRFEITRQVVRRAMETLQDGDLPLPAEGEPVPGYVLVAGTSSEGRGGPAMPTLLPDILMVGNEWRFARPLRMGERFTVVTRLASITERMGGRFGYSVFFRTEAEYRDEEDTLAALTATTMMQYDARNAGDPGKVGP